MVTERNAEDERQVMMAAEEGHLRTSQRTIGNLEQVATGKARQIAS
jgi:hypothetical protein